MKYVGVWWEMHLELKPGPPDPSTAPPPRTPNATSTSPPQHGFGGVLVEGWNKGWDGDWFANGEDFSFTETYPDFDIERLTALRRAEGRAADRPPRDRRQHRPLRAAARAGARPLRSGSACDCGQDRLRRRRRRRAGRRRGRQGPSSHGTTARPWPGTTCAWCEAAAKRHIAVNAHEPIKDTGLRRTYPNWIGREGARGMEYNAWGNPRQPARARGQPGVHPHAGRADGLHPRHLRHGDAQRPAASRPPGPSSWPSTSCIYSPIQMAADLLENYEANPDALPVHQGRAGRLGRDARAERRDRRLRHHRPQGSQQRRLVLWAPSPTSNARSLSAPLDFLDAGRRYRAQIYRDGPNADYRGQREDIVIEQREVTSADTLTLSLAPGGGQAIRFVPLGRKPR